MIDALQRVAGDRPIAGQRHVDAEVGPAVRRDQERAVHHLEVRHVVVCPAARRLARAQLLGRVVGFGRSLSSITRTL